MTNVLDFTPPARERKYYCSKCDTPAACDCGPEYYLKAGAYAKHLLKDPANRAMPDTHLMRKYGVSDKTFAAARQAVSENSETRRVGIDGKSYPARRNRSSRKRDMAKAVVKERLRNDEPISRDEVASDLGVSHATVDTARVEAEAEIAREDAALFAKPLAPSAQARYDAYCRRFAQGLQKEYAQTFADWQQKMAEEVDRQVKAQTAERLALLEEQQRAAQLEYTTYRDLRNGNKPILTRKEFLLIVRCLHSDSRPSESDLNEACGLITAKKLQLTGER